jgi:polar amino acid transport system substrate-binding protein
VSSFAASMGVRVEWYHGGADELLHRLARRELDVVAAGLAEDSPWRHEVGLTRRYGEASGSGRVLAVAPGENAMLVALERHLRAQPPLGRRP